MKKIIFIISILWICNQIISQEARNEIKIPDIMGYYTLKGDFHIHTVFSDGKVWPDVRVTEAWMEGLDAIAITEHIEYPNKLLPPDKNMSYNLALDEARKRNIILIKGAEITRKLPEECGHMNALFLTDINKLNLTDFRDAIKEASNQGAFIFWNHPGWYAQQPDTTLWFDVFSELQKNNMLHGIEVVNWKRWFPEALPWCLEKNLTLMANSDIHEPIGFTYNFEKGEHRPITLIFAKEKTQEGIKDALMSHRTVAWFKRGFYNELWGREEFLKELFLQSIDNEVISNSDKSLNIFMVNKSDLDFQLLKRNSDTRVNYRKNYFLNGSTREEINIVKVKPIENKDIVLHFVIENLISDNHQPIKIDIPLNKYLK
ncbi:MAG: histidinol-phosphatase [Bacteroidetes bacterium]|nr:histidinol-phosphatase [Bacteroidota bacterium]